MAENSLEEPRTDLNETALNLNNAEMVDQNSNSNFIFSDPDVDKSISKDMAEISLEESKNNLIETAVDLNNAETVDQNSNSNYNLFSDPDVDPNVNSNIANDTNDVQTATTNSYQRTRKNLKRKKLSTCDEGESGANVDTPEVVSPGKSSELPNNTSGCENNIQIGGQVIAVNESIATTSETVKSKSREYAFVPKTYDFKDLIARFCQFPASQSDSQTSVAKKCNNRSKSGAVNKVIPPKNMITKARKSSKPSAAKRNSKAKILSPAIVDQMNQQSMTPSPKANSLGISCNIVPYIENGSGSCTAKSYDKTYSSSSKTHSEGSTFQTASSPVPVANTSANSKTKSNTEKDKDRIILNRKEFQTSLSGFMYFTKETAKQVASDESIRKDKLKEVLGWFKSMPHVDKVTVRKFCSSYKTKSLMPQLNSESSEFKETPRLAYEFPEDLRNEALMGVVKDYVHFFITEYIKSTMRKPAPAYIESNDILKFASTNLHSRDFMAVMHVFKDGGRIPFKEVVGKLTTVALFVIFEENKKQAFEELQNC